MRSRSRSVSALCTRLWPRQTGDSFSRELFVPVYGVILSYVFFMFPTTGIHLFTVRKIFRSICRTSLRALLCVRKAWLGPYDVATTLNAAAYPSGP